MAIKRKPIVKMKKTIGKKRGPKTGSKHKQTRIEVVNHDDSEYFTVHEGVPNTRLRASNDEQLKLLTLLVKLVPNKNHVVVPARLKYTIMKLAARDYPQYTLRTAANREKGTVSIWRTR